MIRIMEASDWVVMAWRCDDDEQAMRRASSLHSERERKEFMRQYRWLSRVRRLWGDTRAADEIIRRGDARLARRQPLIMSQVYLLMHLLDSSAVLAPMSECLLVLGSLADPWYPRGCSDRKAAYRMAMSDDVAGIAIDDDNKAIPVYIGWEPRIGYGIGSDDDDLLVEHLYSDGTTIFVSYDDDDDDDDEA